MTPQRTDQQNKALHLYLELVAKELDREGHTIQDVVKEIKKAEIKPTKENLKEVVWKPLQEVLYGKKSTTELTKHEVTEVYEHFNRFIAKFGVHIPFPTEEHDDLAINARDKVYTRNRDELIKAANEVGEIIKKSESIK